MTFLTPTLAALAAAVAVPTLLILYFLKLRRREVEISSTLLWKKAIQDLQANAPFQRLRRNLLLLLQLLVLGACLFALAQPQVRGTAQSGERHVILIDRSASMSAADGDKQGASRLDAAKRQALDLIDSIPEPNLLGRGGGEAMVIAFDTAAEVRQGFTSSRADLRRAIESVTPTDGRSALGEAFTLAKAYAGKRQIVEDKGLILSGPTATIHLFSDGRLDDAATVTPEVEDQVVYHPLGTSGAANVGITSVRAERSFDDPSRLSIFVGLQSTAPLARSVDVQLALDGQVAAVKSVALSAATPAERQPGGAGSAAPAASAATAAETESEPIPASSGAVFTLTRAQAAVVSVRLRHPSDAAPDVLAADDEGYLVVPPAKRLSVALVTEGNFVLSYALEGLNLASLRVMTPAEYQRLIDVPASPELAAFDLTIFDRWLPTRKATGNAGGDPKPGLPPGRCLVFGVVPPPPRGLTDKGGADAALVLDWARDHPALRGISLDALTLYRARRVEVEPRTPVRVLALSSVGPAIVEVAELGYRAIVAPFDLMESTWPLDPSFVLFLASSVRYLGHDSGLTAGAEGQSLGQVRTGSTLAELLPSGARDVRLALPGASGQVIGLSPSADDRVAYGPVTSRGIHTLTWEGLKGPTDVEVDGRPRRAIAANLCDASESNLGVRSRLELASRVVQARVNAGGPGVQRLWPWLLLFATLVAMLEWYIYNRRVYL